MTVGVEGNRADAAIQKEARWIASESIPGRPVEGIATVIRNVLASAEMKPSEMDSICYSGGPGSLLALRTLSMILESWKGLDSPSGCTHFRFSGLIWTAREILRTGRESTFTVLSPWRRGACFGVFVDENQPNEKDIELFDTEKGTNHDHPTFLLGEDRHGIDLTIPVNKVLLPELTTLQLHLDQPGFLVETQTVSPLFNGKVDYKKWFPK